MAKKINILFLLFFVLLNACAPQAKNAASSQPSSPSPAADSALSAVLSEIGGKVETREPQADAFQPAQLNSVLNINGQALTGSDGRARLDLSSGTIFRVAPNSLFTLISNEETPDGLKTRLQLAIGKIFIILNGGSTEVETSSGTAAVHGSYMSVSFDPTSGETRITCLEGYCSLGNASGKVEITAGQTALIRGAGQPPQSGEMSDADIQEWLDANPEAALVIPTPIDVPTLAVTAISPVTDLPPTPLPSTVMPAPAPGNGNPPIENNPIPTAAPTLVASISFSGVAPTSSVVGEPLSISVSLVPAFGAPAPTGGVQVFANSQLICSGSIDETGSAFCSGGIAAAGTFNIVAKYLGDAKYLPSQSSPLTGYYVSQASTTTTIVSHAPNPSLVGAAVTFTATVDVMSPGSGTPFGNVTFSDGTNSCVDYAAPWSCSMALASVGVSSVSASYSGSSNFTGSISSLVSQDVLANANTEFRNVTAPTSTLGDTTQCVQTYQVDVLDVNGVSHVKVEYGVNNNSFLPYDASHSVLLTNVSGNTWQGSFSIPATALDTVFWRFIAFDNASNILFFGGSSYANGYPGGAVNAYAFDLDSMFLGSCP